jgi:hypothetical protein
MTIAKRKVLTAKYSGALALAIAQLASASVTFAQYPYPSGPMIKKDGTAVVIEDYASLPLSSPTRAGQSRDTIDYKLQLGRGTAIRWEPSNAPLAKSREFVIDESMSIYIFDKATKKFTPYLTFPDIFQNFMSDTGTTAGIVSIVFDPEYAKNGKFYTVHTELLELGKDKTPTNAHTPGLDLTGYTTTPTVMPTGGETHMEAVLVEWTDTNIKNATFEGTARELLRVGYARSHPMDDLMYNPLAKPGSSDYRNLYVSIGDGFSGETPGPGHTMPQQLNTLLGKILRITPDLTLRPNDRLSPNGRYRIPSTGPDPNPFVSVAGARGEIWAYGFRHPHRMNWDVPSNKLIVADIGARYWEAVYIVRKGDNGGYAEREGNEQFFVDSESKTTSLMNPPVPFPDPDLLHVDGLNEPVAPIYPSAVYSHTDGDAIASGFVYRGKLMPAMRGKYIFSDITNGRIFYTDLAEMIAGHGQRNKQATIHEIQIQYKSPYDSAEQKPVDRRMYDIIADAYRHKGGTPPPDHVLPGGGAGTTGWLDKEHKHPKADPEGVPWGGGRADGRIVPGDDGEFYILTKSDGMIRKFIAATPPPSISK